MYKRIESIEEIFRTTGAACWLGGGTDMIPLMHLGVKEAEALADYTNVKSLREIGNEDGSIFVGSAVTLAEIADAPSVLSCFPALVQGAKRCASPQIRSVATVGGNIMQDRRCIYFNQSVEWRSSFAPCFKTGGSVCYQIPNSPACRALYYSDLAVSLVLYDAVAVVVENGMQTEVPVMELIKRHVRENGMPQKSSPFFILGFRVPKPPESERSLFFKYSLRSSLDFPVVNFGVRFSKSARPAKVVAGAAAETPLILEKSAQFMDEKQCWNGDIASAAVEELNAKARIVRESVVTPKIKKMSFNLIGSAIKKCMAEEASNSGS